MAIGLGGGGETAVYAPTLDEWLASEPSDEDLTAIECGLDASSFSPNDLAPSEVELVKKIHSTGSQVTRVGSLSSSFSLDDLETKGWQDFANCRGVDPDLFFPERGASTREAKEVCKGCTVREDCLEYALSNVEKFGIWGGLSERERRRVRRQRVLARRSMLDTTISADGLDT